MHAQIRQLVRCNGGMTAAVRKNGNALVLDMGKAGQGFGRGEQFIGIFDNNDAGPSKGGPSHLRHTCQSTCVRTRRKLSRGGTATLEHHDGLFPGGLIGLLKETATIPHPLHIHEDGPGVRVFLKKGQILVELEIRLVPDTHVISKSLTALDGGFGNERQGHVAALANQGNIPFWHFF